MAGVCVYMFDYNWKKCPDKYNKLFAGIFVAHTSKIILN